MAKNMQESVNKFVNFINDKAPNVLHRGSLKNLNYVNDIFAIVLGTIALVASANVIWKYYAKPFPDLETEYKGTFAVITGATGRFGIEISRQLASKGINLVLISRCQTRLTDAVSDLMAEFPEVVIKTIVFDASNYIDLRNIQCMLQGLHISLLFNMLGIHNPLPILVEDQQQAEVSQIVQVNCIFPVHLTAVIIPLMKKYARNTNQSSQSMRPAIVNFSSFASRSVFPFMSVYAATSAFEEHFSECLAEEILSEGIDTYCFRLGPYDRENAGKEQQSTTSPASTAGAAPSLFSPTPATLAYSCLRFLGSGYHKTVTPYAPHAALDWVSSVYPRLFLGKVRYAKFFGPKVAHNTPI
jgi:17beta-estradiol 17-dehydrogenase / very-long-chain 3-oxoacyl-CoA reductase